MTIIVDISVECNRVASAGIFSTADDSGYVIQDATLDASRILHLASVSHIKL